MHRQWKSVEYLLLLQTVNTSWIFILVERGRDPISDREKHMGTFQSMEKENVGNHLVGHPKAK